MHAPYCPYCGVLLGFDHQPLTLITLAASKFLRMQYLNKLAMI